MSFLWSRGVYEIQPKAFIGRNTLVGPKLLVSIQADFLKPVSLTVDYNKAAVYKAGEALTGELTKHTSSSSVFSLFGIGASSFQSPRSPVLCFYLYFVGVRVKPRNCIWHFFQEATKMIYFGLKSDAEYWTVCQGKTIHNTFTNLWILFFDFSKKIWFALQKTVQIDTRFCPDTDVVSPLNMSFLIT